MGPCFVSRILGLQRIDGCCISQCKQCKQEKNDGKAEEEESVGGTPYRQPKSIGGGEISPQDLGALSHPPPTLKQLGWEGIKVGNRGIRIGTSDRFGRGRGELKLLVLDVLRPFSGSGGSNLQRIFGSVCLWFRV